MATKKTTKKPAAKTTKPKKPVAPKAEAATPPSNQ